MLYVHGFKEVKGDGFTYPYKYLINTFMKSTLKSDKKRLNTLMAVNL